MRPTSDQQNILDYINIHRHQTRVAIHADAGTGKTTTLVQCVRAVLQMPDALPRKILCLSFTEKSKNDLLSRFTPQERLRVEVFTIHGFCNHLVRRQAFQVVGVLDYVIADADQEEALFNEAFEICFSGSADWAPLLHRLRVGALKAFMRKAIATEASYGSVRLDPLKNPLGDSITNLAGVSSNYAAYKEHHLFEIFFHRLKEQFQRQKLKANKITYNDLERYAFEWLRLPESRSVFEQEYGFVFVDEFQDTSLMQCKIIERMFTKSAQGLLDEYSVKFNDPAFWSQSNQRIGLLVVGDPKQSIYRFRGAQVEVFEEFSTFLKNFHLKTNFRSQPLILSAVNSVGRKYIKNYIDMQAFDGLHSKLSSDAFVATLDVAEFADSVELLSSLYRKLSLSGDVALLLRRFKGNEPLIQQLIQSGVPVTLEISRNPIKISQVYLFFLMFLFVYRSWSDAVVERLKIASSVYGFDYNALELELKSLSGLTYVDVCRSLFLKPFVLKSGLSDDASAGIKLQLEAYFLDATVQQKPRVELLETVSSIVFGDEGSFSRDAEATIDLPYFMLERSRSNNSLRVLTIHSSKGLEFQSVILFDLKEKRRPTQPYVASRNQVYFLERGSAGRDDLKDCPIFKGVMNPIAEYDRLKEDEESFRLLYVAMTRAKNNLVACVDSSSKKLSGWEGPLTKALTAVKRSEFEWSLSQASDIESTSDFEMMTRQPGGVRRPNTTAKDSAPEAIDLSASVGVLRHQQLTAATKHWPRLVAFLSQTFNAQELTVLSKDVVFQSIFNFEYIAQRSGLVFDELPVLIAYGAYSDVALYRVDRVVVYPEHVLVVDYKFSQQNDLEYLLTTYRAQLAHYKKILFEIYQRPVIGYLFDVQGQASRKSGFRNFIHEL